MTQSYVPIAYVGVWRRTLLETSTLRDTTSSVFWLQTRVWHGDIRIPAHRPALSCDTLAQLDRSALQALTQQQGFAGVTEVTADICRWHRQIDYQPRSRFNDIASMRFDTPDRLLEYGVEQAYFEVWERMPDSGGESEMIELAAPSQPRAVMLRAGDFVMLVRDRSVSLPAADNLATLGAGMSQDALARALNLEISFGRRVDQDAWRVELSTLPWREGAVLSLRAE
jgi:hypothetical protein